MLESSQSWFCFKVWERETERLREQERSVLAFQAEFSKSCQAWVLHKSAFLCSKLGFSHFSLKWMPAAHHHIETEVTRRHSGNQVRGRLFRVSTQRAQRHRSAGVWAVYENRKLSCLYGTRWERAFQREYSAALRAEQVWKWGGNRVKRSKWETPDSVPIELDMKTWGVARPKQRPKQALHTDGVLSHLPDTHTRPSQQWRDSFCAAVFICKWRV